MSRYYRKITFGVRKEAAALVARYSDKTPEEIIQLANIDHLYQKYGRIEDFKDSSEYNEWNFWTYIKRSAEIMRPLDNIIIKQLRNSKRKIERTFEKEVVKQHYKRLKREEEAEKKSQTQAD